MTVVANCRDIYFPVPFPPSPFGFRRMSWGPPLPESRGERSLFRPSWKMWRIFRESSCGHFSCKFEGENQRKFSPKFRCVFRPCRRRIRLNFALGNFLQNMRCKRITQLLYHYTQNDYRINSITISVRNSVTQITEHNSQDNLVRGSVILSWNFLPRPSNSRSNSVR